MLCALMNMYSLTTSILGSVVITCTIGVCQGSSTSMFLFIICRCAIRMLKERSPLDGFLSWLHVLMLMDNMVTLATSRVSLIRKLSILNGYCDEYGMHINEFKTELMVVDGLPVDCTNIAIDGLKVTHCSSYAYLRVIVIENGSLNSTLKAHVAKKKKHLNYLNIFLARNHDAPFFVKKKVFDAAFFTAILYGCESWLGISLYPVDSYTAVHNLLRVRKSTP